MVTDKNTVRLIGTVIGDMDAAARVCDFMASSVTLPTVETLSRCRGIGPKRAEKIMACMEMSKHYFVGIRAKEFNSADDVAFRLSFLKYETQEKFVVMTLDSSMHEIAVHEVYCGLVNAVPVHPREIFRHALVDNAVYVIVAHNHPSGNPEPSSEDISLTRVMCAAGKIMKIPVLDHLVISKGGHTSICLKMPELFEKNFPEKTMEVTA